MSTTRAKTRPRVTTPADLEDGDRVACAGLAGTVVKVRAGTADGDLVYGQPDPLTAVWWDGQPGAVPVRTRLLTRIPERSSE